MADDGSAQSSPAWPITKFRFELKWDATVMSFQEVSGLDIASQPIEYRHGNSPQFSVIKMPGLRKFANVTLKRGLVNNDHQLWDWFNDTKLNTIRRKTVTITLLDEARAPTMVWTLANAWPSKISSTDLNATGNEVVLETLVISHEGLTIANA